MSPTLRVVLMVVVLCLSAAAQARGLRVHVDSAESAQLTLRDIDVELTESPAGARRVSVAVAQISLGQVAVAPMALSAECELLASERGWRCAGNGSLLAGTRSRGAAAFAAEWVDGRMALAVSKNASQLSVSQAPTESAAWHLELRQLPLEWLAELVQAQWPELASLRGQLHLSADVPAAAAAAVKVDYRLNALAFDSQSGRYAGNAIGARGAISLSSAPRGWRLTHRGRVLGGELLWGEFYTQRPDTPLQLDFDLAHDTPATYAVSSLRLADAGALLVEGAATWVAGQAEPLRLARVDRAELEFPGFLERYAKSLLAARGYAELAAKGRVAATFELADGHLQAWSAQIDALTLDDGAHRFALDGLRGRVRWQENGQSPGEALDWNSARLFSLPLGPAHARLHSHDGVLRLADRLSVPVLGGAVELNRLEWRWGAARGERLRASAAVHDVDLLALSRQLGWPEFGGKLGGAVPELRYVDERIELGGGLMLNVFDGTVNVTAMALERPFGQSPSLSADIALANLDLDQVTHTFDIGSISGRLSGALTGLRLVDWAPVAFDAHLQALDGGRISQRAVNTISSVGGGGLAAGLQASLLRLFDTFGYARLGIGCRLQGGVCHMRGLDTNERGYSLVEGRGLPRIRIVGHQTEVDWTVLVDRLKAASSGTKPVIN